MKKIINHRILITGGHLTPALAVLDELIAKNQSNIIWVGTKYSQTGDKQLSAEYNLVKQYGIKFIDLKTGKIWRKWTPKTFSKALYNLWLIPGGFLKSIWIILSLKPSVVMSFGGYLALPIVVSAKIFGKKVYTHEQTITTGLANKIIGRFANKILLSWPQSLSNFPNNKVLLTGNPIRKQSLTVTTDQIKFTNNLPILYITGGNQGANTINWRVDKILLQLLKQVNIIHQTGKSSITNDYQIALSAKNALPPTLKNNYLVYDNIFSAEIGEIYSKADLILSRAGANTVIDIIAHNKLAIVIPLPWSSQNEQLLNAQLLQKLGLAFVIKQHDSLKPEEIYSAITLALEKQKQKIGFNDQPLIEIKKQSQQYIKPDAAKDICELLLQVD